MTKMQMTILGCLVVLFLFVQTSFAVDGEDLAAVEAKNNEFVAEDNKNEPKVRTKRKLAHHNIDEIAEADKEPELEVAPPAPVEPQSDHEKLEGIPPTMDPLTEEKDKDEEEGGVRAKKQACKGGCGGNRERMAGQPIMLMRTADDTVVPVMPEDLLVPIEKGKMQGGRTIEPIYSFGPVHVNGVGGSGLSGASYAPAGISSASGYSGYSSGGSSASSYAPASLQLSAVLPYSMMHHQIRRPYLHQALSGQSFVNRNPIGYKPEIVYYEAPTPIYMTEAADAHHYSQAQGQSFNEEEQAPLYCQPLKNSDLAKKLSVDEKEPADKEGQKDKAPEEVVPSEGELNDHIKRVNEIRDEIAELNKAAQKIVEQQEALARMQSDHFKAAAVPVPVRSLDPLMRYHEEQARMHPTSMHYPMMRPYRFREAELPAGEQKTDGVKTDESSAVISKKDETKKDEIIARQMPFGGYPMYGYGGYYPHFRSETGFPTPSLYRSNSNAASYPSTEEDVKFFQRLLEAGKKMGYLSTRIQAAPLTPQSDSAGKSPDASKEHKSEGTIGDLTNGSSMKSDENKEEEDSNEEEKKKTKSKRDHRGLIMKSKI